MILRPVSWSSFRERSAMMNSVGCSRRAEATMSSSLMTFRILRDTFTTVTMLIWTINSGSVPEKGRLLKREIRNGLRFSYF